ncbi:hypothetical protein CDAR_425711 [Caerostris darwini]|uniref:Uncharacterized protein n=1 Tax=Caerostris darwini TaxID=1538125 RepID=A0AAV4N1L8_9ARAC|nr:hypothetical protein CDAR_425711 [Caerostris darwini]
MNISNLPTVQSESLESLDLKTLPSRRQSLLRKHCCKSKKLVSLEDHNNSPSDSESAPPTPVPKRHVHHQQPRTLPWQRAVTVATIGSESACEQQTI